MNDLVTDVKNLELDTLENLKNSKALNTLRAYKADYKDFSGFCIKHGFRSMPSEPKIISLYLTHLSKTSKFSTLKRRLASISILHKIKGHYIDIKHPIIMENLMGIKRANGSNQKGKKPLLISDLKALINAKSAEILSRPSILVLDGRQARIQIGQQIPITKLPVSSYSGDEILIPDIEYLPVGIVLNIKPRISNDLKNVTMQVETIITETENFSSSGVLEAPIINNRKVESYVKVADNTPFIIGGLISNKESDNEGKIPFISKIPWLGKLFTWKAKQIIKKEVIVVITPHIIEDNSDNFSRVIPQDAKMFDSFGNKLFPNSYRLKESDIYDLSFITDSNYLDYVKQSSKTITPESDEQKNIIEDIQSGFIPGEKIITQRMIYDIIEREEYFNSVNSEKIIFFNHNKNHKVDKLKNYFSIIDDPRRGILIKINPSISDNQNFFRPSMIIEEVVLTENYNFKEELQNYWNLEGDLKPVLITNQKNLIRLYEVLILNEVLKLNNTLDLSINQFKRGLEIQFPAREIISENSFVIDEKIADFYYQVNFYYDSFEEEFKNKTSFLSK